jgi:hypothetical protein
MAPSMKQEDDALGLCGERRAFRSERVVRIQLLCSGFVGNRAQQSRQSEMTESCAGSAKKITARGNEGIPLKHSLCSPKSFALANELKFS